LSAEYVAIRESLWRQAKKEKKEKSYFALFLKRLRYGLSQELLKIRIILFFGYMLLS
jgi:hypothetical protein